MFVIGQFMYSIGQFPLFLKHNQLKAAVYGLIKTAKPPQTTN